MEGENFTAFPAKDGEERAMVEAAIVKLEKKKFGDESLWFKFETDKNRQYAGFM